MWPERPEALVPKLERNRRQFDHLLRWKRRLAVAAIPTITAVAVMVPAPQVEMALVSLFVLLLLAFGVLEVLRSLVFRRDVRERKGAPQSREE